MNFLIISPKYPIWYWNFDRVLNYFPSVLSFPPLILLNLSSMLPKVWNKKLIDMNTRNLNDEDILWADYVLINAKIIQAKSANKIIERCRKLNTKTVACGSLFKNNDEYYKYIDYLVCDESEITLPQFLSDLAEEKTKRKFESKTYSNITSAY